MSSTCALHLQRRWLSTGSSDTSASANSAPGIRAATATSSDSNEQRQFAAAASALASAIQQQQCARMRQQHLRRSISIQRQHQRLRCVSTLQFQPVFSVKRQRHCAARETRSSSLTSFSFRFQRAPGGQLQLPFQRAPCGQLQFPFSASDLRPASASAFSGELAPM